MKVDYLEDLVYYICLANGLKTWKLSHKKTEYNDKPDLHAFWKNYLLLVECKNWKEKAGLPELDSFYSKITRRNPLTIGLYVSFNGFTKEFVDMVKSNYERSIILLDKRDLLNIVEMSEDLEDILEFRLLMLQRGIIDVGTRSSFMDIPILLNTENKFNYYKNKTIRSFHHESEEDLADNYVFVIDGILDRMENFNAKLELKLHKKSLNEIIKIFSIYSFIFGFENESSYTINQFYHRWLGIGIKNFFDECLVNNNNRYKSLSENCQDHHHHRAETVSFVHSNYNQCLIIGFDPVTPYSNGNYEFRCRNFNLKIYFNEAYSRTGIEKFLNLINYNTSYESTKLDNFLFITLNEPIIVEAVEFIEDPEYSEDNWPELIGIVFKNPFSNELIQELIEEEQIDEFNSFSLEKITHLEYLIGRANNSFSLDVEYFVTLSQIKILIDNCSGFNQFICEFLLYFNPNE